MGSSTISMAIFISFLYVYQRVMVISYTMVEIPISLGGEKNIHPLQVAPLCLPAGRISTRHTLASWTK
jgi:hypothetical protein